MKISEAMVTYKEKSSEEESSEKDPTRFIFVPFVSDVRVGHNCNELTQPTAPPAYDNSAAADDFQLCSSSYNHHHSGSGASGLLGGTNLGTPGAGSGLPLDHRGRGMEKITPPSSPSISKYSFDIGSVGGSGGKSSSSRGSDGGGNSHEEGGGLLELQLDYWTTENCDLHLRKSESEKSKKQDSKLTIKNYFRSLAISNLAGGSVDSGADFTMKYTTKEKRPKAVLKLGKKKDKPQGQL